MTLDDLITGFISLFRREFTKEEKARLREARVSSSLARKYHKDFGLEGTINLVKECVPHEFANQHRAFFYCDEHLAAVFNSGMSIEEFKEYNTKGFEYDKSIAFFESDIAPERAKRYHDIFYRRERDYPDYSWGPRYNEYNLDGFRLVKLINQGVTEDEAKRCFERFGLEYTKEILDADIPVKTALQYAPHITKSVIFELYQRECMPEHANKFHPELYKHSVKKGGTLMSLAAVFLDLECPPETANMYADIGLGDVVVDLTYRANINPETLTRKQIHAINKLSQTDDVTISEIRELSRGVSGIVGFTNVVPSLAEQFGHIEPKPRKPRVWKLAPDVTREYELHNRVQQYHKKNQQEVQNVVKILGMQEGIILDLERIRGKTLSQVLESQDNLSAEKVLRYSSQIFNGIREIHEAGVYHRDMHDRNILIGKIKDKAVIIDLGIATTDPNDIYYEGNPRYGGNNDLVSLGTLMYKMATGHNLFNDESQGRTIERKPEVKRDREEAYNNNRQGLREKYFPKVKQNVQDPKIAGLIINLLEDELWKQPTIDRVHEVQKMFQRYAA